MSNRLAVYGNINAINETEQNEDPHITTNTLNPALRLIQQRGLCLQLAPVGFAFERATAAVHQSPLASREVIVKWRS